MLRITRILTGLSAAFLMTVAAAKLYTLVANPPILTRYDPVLFFQNRYILMTVALAEIAAAGILVSGVPSSTKGVLLLWLSLSFSAYKTAVFLGGYPAECPCLGSVGSKMGLSPANASAITWMMLSFFFFSGSFLFAVNRRAERPAGPGPIEESGTEHFCPS